MTRGGDFLTGDFRKRFRRFAVVGRVGGAVAAALVIAASGSGGVGRGGRAVAVPDGVVSERDFVDALGARVEALVTAGRWDSVLVLAAALIDSAAARRDSSLLAAAVVSRGRAHLAARRLDGARGDFERAVDIGRATRDTTVWMTGLGFGGMAAGFQGRWQESAEMARERVRLALLARDEISEAWACVTLGYGAISTGDYETAREHYRRAADIFAGKRADGFELTARIGLGRAMDRLGDRVGAQTCYRRAWAVARRLGDVVQQAHAINNLGVIEYQSGDMARAAEYFEQAFRLSLAAGQKRDAAAHAVNVAYVRAAAGNYGAASRILDEAEREYAGADDADFHAQLVEARATLEMWQGRHAAALVLCRRELTQEASLPSDRHDRCRVAMWGCLVRLDSVPVVLADARAHPPAEMDPSVRPGGHLVLSNAMNDAGEYGAALANARAAESLAGKTGDYRIVSFAWFAGAEALSALGDAAGAARAVQLGIDASEMVRASQSDIKWRFVTNLGTPKVVDIAECVLGYPPEVPRQDRIAALFTMIQNLKTRGLAESLIDPRAGVDSSTARFYAGIAAHDIQRDALCEGELLLEFAIGYDRALLFAVTRDTLRMVDVPPRDADLNRSARLSMSILSSPPDSAAAARRAALDVGTWDLSKVVLGPVADLLKAAERVLIAPDGFYHMVPFELLPVEGMGGGRVPLAEAKEVARVPSGSVLWHLRARTRRRSTGAGLKRRDETVAGHSVVIGPSDRALRGAAAEARALSSRYRGVDVSADAREVLTATRRPAPLQMVHVATHVLVNPDAPWRSGILVGEVPRLAGADVSLSGELAADKTPLNAVASRALRGLEATVTFGDTLEFVDDPYVRAGDIMKAAIPTRVAVLSGCSSARGRATLGEGVAGLSTAFLSAGAGAVVASLWPVDDAATERLMDRFYDGLSDGKSVAAALRDAQRRLRRNSRTRDPFYWAGFTVIGDGALTVSLERRARLGSVPLAAGAVVVAALSALVFVAWRRRRRRRRRGEGMTVAARGPA